MGGVSTPLPENDQRMWWVRRAPQYGSAQRIPAESGAERDRERPLSETQLEQSSAQRARLRLGLLCRRDTRVDYDSLWYSAEYTTQGDPAASRRLFQSTNLHSKRIPLFCELKHVLIKPYPTEPNPVPLPAQAYNS